MSQPQVMRTQPAPLPLPKKMTFTSVSRTTAPMPASRPRMTSTPTPVRTVPMQNTSYKPSTTSTSATGHTYTSNINGNNNYRVNSATAKNTYALGSKPSAPTNGNQMRMAARPVLTNNSNNKNNNNIKNNNNMTNNSNNKNNNNIKNNNNMIRNTNGSVTRAAPVARPPQMASRPTYVNSNNNNINNRLPYATVKKEYVQHNSSNTRPAMNPTYVNNNINRNNVQFKKQPVKPVHVKQQHQSTILRTPSSVTASVAASRLADSGLREALPPFLKKLRTITDTVSSDIAAWSADGRSFMIHNSPRFEEVLGKHFKGNISTFVRQLHFYTFKKAEKNGGGWSFAHKSFLREYPHLMYEIKRKTRNEPGEGAASQAEVQSLRTQVAFLQDVVEELRTQLEVVLKVVDNDEVAVPSNAEGGAKKQQQHKKQKQVGAPLSASLSQKPSVAGGQHKPPGVNQKSAAAVASAAAAAAVSGVKRVRAESATSSSSTETATAASNPFSDWFGASDVSSPVSQASSMGFSSLSGGATAASAAASMQPLSLDTSALEDVDMMDAASLGSLTEEDWLNTLAMDCDEKAGSSSNSDAGNSVDFLTLSRSNSLELMPIHVAPISPTSKQQQQVLADASDATRLVADATKLDVGTVAKVLECLRVAAVKLAAESAAASSAATSSSFSASSSSSSSGARVLTPRSSSTPPAPRRATTPTPVASSTKSAATSVPSASAAIRPSSFKRSNSMPSVPCAQQARQVEAASSADQAAMLLPLLMTSVQSALLQYQQFDKVAHTSAHA